MFKAGPYEKNDSQVIEAGIEYNAGSQSCLFINNSP